MSTGGLLTGSLRDIEKQFGFTSKQTGFIIVSNDIAALLSVPVVSFYGERGNKPKWIAFGTMLCGIIYSLNFSCRPFRKYNRGRTANFMYLMALALAVPPLL